MRKTLIFYIVLLSVSLGLKCNLFAQTSSYSETLLKVLEGNLGLKAENSRTEAEKLENNTGVNLPNPEVEFAYQFGEDDDKKILDITQGFDFATLSGAKRKLANAKNRNAETRFLLKRSEVAAVVDRLMADIVFQTKYGAFLSAQTKRIEQLYNSALKLFEAGKISIVDLNSAKLALITAQNDEKINTIEREANLSELERLGATKISWDGSEYMDYTLPSDFESWIKPVSLSNADVENAMSEAEVAGQEVNLRKKEQLPGFSLGYTSEMMPYENFYGISLGLELPLWGNKGKLKAAKAAKLASDLAAETAIEEFTGTQKIRFDKAQILGKTWKEISKLQTNHSYKEGLDKLLDEGRISVTEYITQLQPIAELERKGLECERDYQLALTEFRAGCR